MDILFRFKKILTALILLFMASCTTIPVYHLERGELFSGNELVGQPIVSSFYEANQKTGGASQIFPNPFHIWVSMCIFENETAGRVWVGRPLIRWNPGFCCV